MAAPGPQRSRAGSRMGTQMSSAHDAASDDDSHLRVSGNAVNPTNTHCSSIDERVEPVKEPRPEKEKHREKEKERDRSEKEKDKDRDKEERKGSGAAISLPVAGEEWRRWKDNIACSDYAILNTLGRGAFADVCSPHPSPHGHDPSTITVPRSCRSFSVGTNRPTSTMP